ncbi:MAG: cytidylate kinase family protein [Candidatus Micrarchaeota archaeon]|nr:cytidylate kinase family protein [Candidatus Micrarchaeota archaeon]
MAMIRICISGMTASGKTSLGHMLAAELNIAHITKHTLDAFHKATEEATKKGKSKLEVINVTITREHAKNFDDELVQLAAKKDCVITTWLGPWLIKDATLNVWLNASLAHRAERRAKDEKMNVEEARELINEKDLQNMKAFKEVQGIDLNDHSMFDIELNTEKMSLKEMVAVISMMALSKEKKLFT